MELIGYKLEGLHLNKFCKSHEVANTVTIACVFNDYKTLIENRNNKLWDSLEEMKRRIK